MDAKRSAAALICAGLLLAFTAQAQQNERRELGRAPDDYARGAMHPGTSEDAQEQARAKMADVLQAMLTKASFNIVIESLSGDDRKRLARNGALETTDLDRTIDQFQSAWKAKYRRDFEARANLRAAYDYTISETADKRQIAVVIPAAPNRPAVQLKLVNEGSGGNEWRFDVPGIADKHELKAALLRQLRALLEEQQNWPTDELGGKRFAAHEMLAVLANPRMRS